MNSLLWRSTWIGLAATVAISISACLAQTPPSSAGLGGAYKLDRTHASVTWKVSHLGLSNYTARFNTMDAELNYDPSDPSKSSINATIDPASVNTGFPMSVRPEDFDKVLRGDKWFDVAKYPAITFRSTKIEKTSDKTGKITGDLTLHGVTKPVTFDVTLNGAFESDPLSKAPSLGFSASTKIDRTAFGMDALVPYVGSEVTILIEAEFRKK